MTTIYGIANCDKCRKALRWFTNQGLEHHFHDLRRDGLSKKQVSDWLELSEAELLLNRRSTTWRNLPEAERSKANTAAAADLILANPTLIKRPLVQTGSVLIVGYDEQAWREALG